MVESPVFSWAAEQLEVLSKMTRLQARGTLRRLLKDAGLDGETLTRTEWQQVARKMLANALRKQGITAVDDLVKNLSNIPEKIGMTNSDSALEIFRRLGI